MEVCSSRLGSSEITSSTLWRHLADRFAHDSKITLIFYTDTVCTLDRASFYWMCIGLHDTKQQRVLGPSKDGGSRSERFGRERWQLLYALLVQKLCPVHEPHNQTTEPQRGLLSGR